jgi:hypothetical protein
LVSHDATCAGVCAHIKRSNQHCCIAVVYESVFSDLRLPQLVIQRFDVTVQVPELDWPIGRKQFDYCERIAVKDVVTEPLPGHRVRVDR